MEEYRTIGKIDINKLGDYANKVTTDEVVLTKDTIILMKHIDEINRNGRIVIKLAVENDGKHPKNSIITLMELNDRTWKQTLKNRGNVIFEKI